MMRAFGWLMLALIAGYLFFYVFEKKSISPNSPSSSSSSVGIIWDKLKKRLLDQDMPQALKESLIDINKITSPSSDSTGSRIKQRSSEVPVPKEDRDFSGSDKKQLDTILDKNM